MKMKISENIDTFKQMLTLISLVGIETKLMFKDSGVSCVVNNSNAAMAEVIFGKEFFEEYEGTGDYGILLSDLNSVVKKFKTDIIITGDGSRMYVQSGKIKATIPVLEEVDGATEIPEIELTPLTKTTFAEFKETIDMIKTYKPSEIRFFTKDGTLNIEGINGTREMSIEMIDNIEVDINNKYGLNYLMPLATNSNDEFSISVDKDKPLLVTFNKGYAKVKYIIAPRT